MVERMNIKIFHRTMEDLSKGKISRRAVLAFYGRNQDLFEKTGKIYHFNKYKGHDLKTMFQSAWPVVAVPLREKPKKVDEHLTSASSIKESDYKGIHTNLGICIIRRNSEIPGGVECNLDGVVVVFLYHIPGSNIVNFYATSAEGEHRRSYTLILTGEVEKPSVHKKELVEDIPICPKCSVRPDSWTLYPYSLPSETSASLCLLSNGAAERGYNKLILKKGAAGSHTTLKNILCVRCNPKGTSSHVFAKGNSVFHKVLKQAIAFKDRQHERVRGK